MKPARFLYALICTAQWLMPMSTQLIQFTDGTIPNSCVEDVDALKELAGACVQDDNNNEGLKVKASISAFNQVEPYLHAIMEIEYLRKQWNDKTDVGESKLLKHLDDETIEKLKESYHGAHELKMPAAQLLMLEALIRKLGPKDLYKIINLPGRVDELPHDIRKGPTVNWLRMHEVAQNIRFLKQVAQLEVSNRAQIKLATDSSFYIARLGEEPYKILDNSSYLIALDGHDASEKIYLSPMTIAPNAQFWAIAQQNSIQLANKDGSYKRIPIDPKHRVSIVTEIRFPKNSSKIFAPFWGNRTSIIFNEDGTIHKDLGEPHIAALAPDGSYFVTCKNDKCVIHQVSCGKEEILEGLELESVYKITIDPTSERLCITGRQDFGGQLISYSRESQSTEYYDSLSIKPFDTMHFSPDGKQLLTTENDGRRLEIYDLQKRKSRTVSDEAEHIQSLHFSPDSSYFIACGKRTSLFDCRNTEHVIKNSKNDIVYFAPDSSYFFLRSHNEFGDSLDLYSHEGECIKHNLFCDIDDMWFAPDGSFFIIHHKNGKINHYIVPQHGTVSDFIQNLYRKNYASNQSERL